MSIESFKSIDQQSCWSIMQQINNCWYKGKSAQLHEYFNDNIVFNSPDFKHQIIGKENCIQTYADFMSISKVLSYNESNAKVHLFENTAIVTYDFEMKYEQKNKMFNEAGTDIVVFNRYQNNWKAIWRGLTNSRNI